MKRYENVRLRNGSGWIDIAGDELVMPPDTETFQIASPESGSEGFHIYAVELPRPVAVLVRSSPSWRSDEKAVARLLSRQFAIVVNMWPDGPGAAVAKCYSSETDPLEDAACALWALKAKGGWNESAIMKFRISIRSAGPHDWYDYWMTARSSDAFCVEVSKVAFGGWDAVRADLVVAANAAAMRVILVDLDWMMAYNDAYAHEQGDLLIARLWSCFEEVATRNGANVWRVAGEKFAVVVKEAEPGSGARLAEALRQSVEDLNIPFRHEEVATLGHVTVSAGVVAASDFARVKDEASDAVYDAKRAGRNRVAVRD